MDVLQNMMLFSELVQCGGNVYTWCYDAKGKLLRSNCPDEAFLASAFELFGCKQRMLEHGNRDDVPVTLGTALGLLWGAAFEKEEGKLKRVWVIGPVFHRDVTMRGIEDGLKYYSKLEISVAWTIQLYKALEKVSTLQNTIIYRYLLMMHYCLTGQRLELSCVNSSTAQEERLESSAIPHDRYKVWMAEQGMLQMVRTGDMNYKQALSNSMSISAGVPVQSSDVLRQSKTSIIVFTSLVCRAAIEGDLSPEEAYSLGDSYIQAAESAKSLDELNPLAMMMYDDFIRRVHKHRTNPNLSMQIQKCVDYIEMNLDKKIVAEDLAVLVGYTEYYLTHKFKEEICKVCKGRTCKGSAEKHTAQRPGNFRTAWFCHPQLFQRGLSAGHRKNAHGIPGNIKQNRHPALPFGGIGRDACSAMMKKNGERWLS